MKKFAIYKTDGTAEIIERINLKLEDIQEVVGGSIEAYYTQNGESIYLNEEGRLYDLPSNPFYCEDLRGNILETGGVDSEGNDLGLPEDYQLRSIADFPKELTEKGNKFTLFWIADSMPMTVKAEVTTSGYLSLSTQKPVFRIKQKRTDVCWSCNNSQVMIFKGWNLPIMTDSDIKSIKKEGEIFSHKILRMNALFNISGLTYDEMKVYVKENQINPFFIQYDHVNYVNDKEEERLLFLDAPATHQRIADMQSEQLNDGVTRLVIN